MPGDEILGFVTRGRGVSVHRADCANAVSLAAGQGDRLIDVDWDESHEGTFVATIEVKALDRGRLLRDVAASMSDHHVNILSSTTHTGSDRVSKMRFEFELADPGHLDSPPVHPARHRQRLRGVPSRARPRRLTLRPVISGRVLARSFQGPSTALIESISDVEKEPVVCVRRLSSPGTLGPKCPAETRAVHDGA